MNRLVELRAMRGETLLTWDVHPEVAPQIRTRLEAEGWSVSLDAGDGPRRRRLPRVERRPEHIPDGTRDAESSRTDSTTG
jgi:hypothetical protein